MDSLPGGSLVGVLLRMLGASSRPTREGGLVEAWNPVGVHDAVGLPDRWAWTACLLRSVYNGHFHHWAGPTPHPRPINCQPVTPTPPGGCRREGSAASAWSPLESVMLGYVLTLLSIAPVLNPFSGDSCFRCGSRAVHARRQSAVNSCAYPSSGCPPTT